MRAPQKLQLTQGLRHELKLNPALVLQQTHFQRLLELPVEEIAEELMNLLAENPYLEEASPGEATEEDTSAEGSFPEAPDEGPDNEAPELFRTEAITAYDVQQDPFAYYSMFWHEPYASSTTDTSEEEEEAESQLPEAQQSFYEALLKQLPLLNLSPEETIFAEELIGSLDPNGYLRESLETVLKQTNARIAEINHERLTQYNSSQLSGNPAQRYALDPVAAHIVLHRELPTIPLLTPLTPEQAEQLLKRLQRELDPPGIGARNLQECLLAQLESRPLRTDAERWAYRILKEAFPALARRTWRELLRHFGGELTPDMLQQAYDVIRHLSPRPGVAASGELPITVLPDFTITHDPETGELRLTINDSILPTLSVNTLLQRLKRLPRKVRSRHYKEQQARQFLRQNYVKSRAIVSALQQRRETLLKVMTAILKLQRDFFEQGLKHLKPMIYADIARETGLDTSTVCRAVANKYVQTDFGIFALKDLFTEALPQSSGEGEVSAEVVKQKLRELLEHEDRQNPLSDKQLAQKLDQMGYKVARRTVAKYREEMGFPPVWKRKALR